MLLPDTIYILATGQSNTWGYGEGGTWDISPLVKVWNNGNDVMDLSIAGHVVGYAYDRPAAIPAGL